MSEPYQPIDCTLHDRLEDWAVRRARCTIEHEDDTGALVRVAGVIVDVGARDGVEYLTLDGGDRIRLDRLRSVNGLAFGEWR